MDAFLNQSLNETQMNSSTVTATVVSSTFGTPLTFTINFIFVPIMYIVGFIGNSICLYVLSRQVKNNEGLRYQIVVVVNDMMGILASTLFRLGTVWFPLAYNSGPITLRSNVIVMGYTAYFGAPNTTICHFVALFITLFVSIDRVLAIYKPFYYKGLNHRRMFYICLFLTVTSSVFLTSPDLAKYYLVYKNELYFILVDHYVVYEHFAYSLATYARLCMRFILLAAIVALNLFVIKRYKHIQKAPAAQSRKKQIISENLLAMFLMLHSFVLGLGQLPLAVACLPLSLDPTFALSMLGQITVDIINTLGAIQWSVSFIFYVGLSKEFRQSVLRSLPCTKRLSKVAPGVATTVIF